MARYTTRTLSAQGWTPRQVLEQLNQALLAEEMTTKGIGPDDDRTCTIVYGRIARLGPEEVGEGVVVTLALGGHPQPFVRRTDGTVETVGRPGDVLGVTPNVEVSEVAVHLRPGEVLLSYTDGVTHARRESRRFGEQRLATLLGAAAVGLDGVVGMAAAGLVADAVADRVLAAVRDFAVTHDDLAVLVLAVA
jgi:hypothetical protein